MVAVVGTETWEVILEARLITVSLAEMEGRVSVPVTVAFCSGIVVGRPIAMGATVNGTESELIPLATATTEYIPVGRPGGSVNSVLTEEVPVITEVLLQL